MITEEKEKNEKILLLLILTYFIPVTVFAWYTFDIKLQNWHLVDSGKHLDWDGNSAYISKFKSAVNVWNNYKSGVIREDTWYNVNGLTISDVNVISQNVIAQTSSNGTIKFSKNLMSKLDGKQQLNVCIHELGHALGLDHREENDTVMYPSVTSINSLSIGDKNNYDASYARY